MSNPIGERLAGLYERQTRRILDAAEAAGELVGIELPRQFWPEATEETVHMAITDHDSSARRFGL